MIFVSIPALLILKCLDEDDKGICRSFFPPMFGEESKQGENEDQSHQYIDKEATHQQFKDL